MLERFFKAKSFRFHVPKVIQVPKNTNMYVFYVFCVLVPYTRQRAIRARGVAGVGRWGGLLGLPFLLSQVKGGSAARDLPGTDKQTTGVK